MVVFRGVTYMDYRIEKDSLGEVAVPSDKLWGAQTQRSYENFRIGKEKIPTELVTVFAQLKKAAAIVNGEHPVRHLRWLRLSLIEQRP